MPIPPQYLHPDELEQYRRHLSVYRQLGRIALDMLREGQGDPGASAQSAAAFRHVSRGMRHIKLLSDYLDGTPLPQKLAVEDRVLQRPYRAIISSIGRDICNAASALAGGSTRPKVSRRHALRVTTPRPLSAEQERALRLRFPAPPYKH